MQGLVQSTCRTYRTVVFARVDLWAREQQVSQADFAYHLSEARFRNDIGNAGDIAQSKVALANFQAALVTAQSNVLGREAALRNVLGLPPADRGSDRTQHTSPPDNQLTWIGQRWSSLRGETTRSRRIEVDS